METCSVILHSKIESWFEKDLVVWKLFIAFLWLYPELTFEKDLVVWKPFLLISSTNLQNGFPFEKDLVVWKHFTAPDVRFAFPMV